MTSSIFFHEVDRCFLVSIFIPAHEYTVLVERESLEHSLLVDLDRDLTLIDRSTDIFSLSCNGNRQATEKLHIFLFITVEVLIRIDSEK